MKLLVLDETLIDATEQPLERATDLKTELDQVYIRTLLKRLRYCFESILMIELHSRSLEEPRRPGRSSSVTAGLVRVGNR